MYNPDIVKLVLYIAICSGSLHEICKADVETDYYSVKKNLIDSLKHEYDPVIIPWTKNNRQFNVFVVLSLSALLGIDEKEETMTTAMTFTLIWWDDKMVWNPADHYNLTRIYMKAADVWKPVWFIPNANDRESVIEFNDWVPICYDFKGMAHWQQMGTIKTSCDIDTTFFPFDTQTCSVMLHWYEYDINTTSYYKDKHLDYYTANGMWNLLEYNMTTQTGFPAFTLTYTFKRKPDFTVFNILFPVLLIAMLGPLVFLLPAESGERIGYSTTMLLTVSVYITIVSEHLPHTSNPMSLLTYMLFSLYVFCTLIVVAIVLTTKLYLYGATTPVPRCLKMFIRVFGCRQLCKRKCMRMRETAPFRVLLPKDSIKSMNGAATPLTTIEDAATRQNETGVNDETGNQTVKPMSEVNWQDIARAVDRVALYGFYLLQATFVLVYVFIFT